MILSKLETISFSVGIIGIIFLPFSLSITQGFLYLASLLLLISLIFNKQKIHKFPIVFVVLYIWLYFISFFHNLSFKEMIQTEGKDIFLVMYFLWSYYFIQSSYQKKLLYFINLVFILFLLIGFISLFVPFRLSNLFYHLKYGFIFDGKIRAQHLIFSLDFLPIHWNLSQNTFPIGIYMPVGFSGTHLSFGAQISMITFYFLSLFYIELFNSNYKKKLILFIVSFYCLILLFFIQARSSIFGFSIMFLTFFITMNNQLHKNVLYKKKIDNIYKSILFFIITIILLIAIAIIQSEAFREIFLQTIGLEKKHTDYQRILLWYTAIRVFFKNPIIGVGLNQFQNHVFQEILTIIQEKPLLWYPLYQTEIMHGHNDLIHFLVIGGIVAGIFYLMFFYTELKNIEIFLKHDSIIQIKRNPPIVFLYLPIFLLFAGLLQCYLLDDYTMQLFWILYGISVGMLNQNIHKKEE